MPYERNDDLPEPVRGNLPQGAQTIYREAFNSAWEQYADPDKRGMTPAGRKRRTVWPGQR